MARLLRLVVPRSLYGQLALIIILGVAGSQIVGVALSLREYQRGGTELFTSVIVDRVASFTNLFESLRPQDRERTAAVMSRASFLVDVVAEKSALPVSGLAHEAATALRGDLLGRLGASYEIEVGASTPVITAEMLRKTDRGALMRPDGGPGLPPGMGIGRPGPEHRPPGRSGPPADEGYFSQVWDAIAAPFRTPTRAAEVDARRRFLHSDLAPNSLIQIRLTDGSWLRFHWSAPTRVFSIPPALAFNWLVLLIAAVAVSVVAAQLAIRPLRRLSNAADNLSRDLKAKPLEEDGPREVAEAARAFNRMHVRLATYLNSRTQMLLAMSHDMKTPLTRLRLRSELLDENEISERIKADLAEMESLVMSTLDYMRGSENREAPVQVDIRALVSAICNDHPVWTDKVVIEAGPPVVLAARPVLLRRAISNLVDNAIRYGDRAELSFSKSAAGECVISIVDDGPGIAEEHLQDVFKPFYRVEESRNRATGGTGLGLAIAREIIEAHGGHIELRNRAGSQSGLEAKVILPARTGQ
ncbi:MAG: ATP-binding protein [Betaproteobacteria bacterium]